MCSLLESKMKAAPKREVSSHRATIPLDRVCFDLSGRQRKRTVGGNKYFGVVVDEATGFVHTICVRHKLTLGKK